MVFVLFSCQHKSLRLFDVFSPIFVCFLGIKQFWISYKNPWQASGFVLLLQEQQAKTLLTAERGHMVQPSLLKALFKAYGLPYLFLGIIKLVNDILNFAGPLLLNVLIRYLETPSEPFDLDPHKAATGNHRRSWLPQPDSLAFGLCCAGLLGITSLIKVCMHLTCLLQHVTTNVQKTSQDC